MPRFAVPGGVLDYDLTGDRGSLVVQLHGLTSSRARDAQLGLDLSRALRGHRLLRYDARGHGRSTGDRNEANYGWDRLAQDLLALLDRVAPDERVHAIGTSMGTGTLLHAAVDDPKRFASLTLVTPPTAWKLRAAQGGIYRASALDAEYGGTAAFIESTGESTVPPALADAPDTAPAITEDLLPIVLRGAAATNFPKRKLVRTITAPTMILAWTADRSHPLKTARALNELIPGSRLVV
ncbi:alpha/beta fold hydrolase, partial [Microbacterium sp.]|uniref:alpha/beta fold hydrolase n=1 Tax=Microbacterium sp. TaxID=51671 RepID=UPI003C73B990